MDAPTKQDGALVVSPEVQRLDELATMATGGMAVGAGPFSEIMGLSSVVGEIRALLTPEMMQPVMALQSTAIGFLTDKDKKKNPNGYGYVKGDGYTVDVVRDVTIEAMTHGARMVANEVNIIGARCYLTKQYFFRALNNKLGDGNWRYSHSIPEVQYRNNEPVGAIVESVIEWRLSLLADWQSMSAKFPIKGDKFSSMDQYLGKADRKAMARLYSQITGVDMPEGDAGDFIDVKPNKPSTAPLFTATNTDHAPEDPRTEPATTETVASPQPDPVEAVTVETAEAVPTMEQKKAMKELATKAGVINANGYLVKHGFISEGQSFRDLDAVQVDRCLKAGQTFLDEVAK